MDPIKLAAGGAIIIMLAVLVFLIALAIQKPVLPAAPLTAETPTSWTATGMLPVVSRETQFYQAPAGTIETVEGARIRNWLNDLRQRIDANRAETGEIRQRVGILARIVGRIETLADAIRSLIQSLIDMIYSIIRLAIAAIAGILLLLLFVGVMYGRLKKRLIG